MDAIAVLPIPSREWKVQKTRETLVYEDNDAFIYRRATSKSGRWYLRIYDGISNKPVVRSLKTIDKVKALATARVMYIDIKGKIERGEKLKQITAEQLIQKYWKLLEDKVSVVPMTGITPDEWNNAFSDEE